MATQSTDLDATAIHRAVSDYFGGWDEGNAQRIGISLNERLAKRAVRRDHRGKEILDELRKQHCWRRQGQGAGATFRLTSAIGR